METTQFREMIVKPTLRYLHPEIPYSEHAVELLMMTMAHESKAGKYLRQVRGPALGAYQMEPDTENDIWQNFLDYRPELSDKVSSLSLGLLKEDDIYDTELASNLLYATAMARVHYYRDPEPLPDGELSYSSTIRELAEYAKRVYNTEEGKATVNQYFNAYLRMC